MNAAVKGELLREVGSWTYLLDWLHQLQLRPDSKFGQSQPHFLAELSLLNVTSDLAHGCVLEVSEKLVDIRWGSGFWNVNM